MKRIVIFFFLIFFTICSIAQKESKFTGVYSQEKTDGNMLSYLYLYISPSNTYAFSFFGGIDMGTWHEEDDYIILQHDTTLNESFYVYAKYNDRIKDVSIQFEGIKEADGLYAFDDDEIMHPIFNDDSRCFNLPYIAHVEKGKYGKINLASYKDLQYTTDIDSVTAAVYTYLLDEKYNDFKVVMNPHIWIKQQPMLGYLKLGQLYINKVLFHKKRYWEAIKEDERLAFEMLTAAIGNTYVSRKYEEDIDGVWVENSYPLLPYFRKEIKTVSFDNINLFETFCDE